MSNIALMNGHRLETTLRTDSDGVPLNVPHYRPVDSAIATDILVAPLKLDGSGSSTMVLDGSSVVQNLWHAAIADKVTIVRTLAILIADGSIVSDGFGGIAALTNGLAIDLVATDGTTVLCDLTGGLSVKSHGDLVSLGADVAFLDAGAGSDLVSVAWDFPTAIELAAGQRFRVRVRDDLTGLVSARAVLTGHTRAA